jgi:hypothetical protein
MPPPGPISRVAASLAMRVPPAAAGQVITRMIISPPSLRRNVCPHFNLRGPRGAIPMTAPHLLKGLSRNEQNVALCHLRGGVHLETDYVADVCLSPRFNQCVFYEEGLTGA